MKKPAILVGFLMVVLLLTVSFSSESATLPSVKPIKDFKDIAGTWQSTFTTNGGREIRGITIISADGAYTYTAKGVAERVITGKLKITEDGKVVNERDGTYTLHEGEGMRVLTLSNPRGTGTEIFVK